MYELNRVELDLALSMISIGDFVAVVRSWLVFHNGAVGQDESIANGCERHDVWVNQGRTGSVVGHGIHRNYCSRHHIWVLSYQFGPVVPFGFSQ
jgi:hypothetical protein